jgi:diadenosine tetraphosphate (Ap4A) HIT family hydrolase
MPPLAEQSGTDDVCYSCQMAATDHPPPRENILRTEHWRVVHAFDSSLPGWLVVLPHEHVTSLAELTPDAAAELGGLLRELSRALHDVVGCTKTYVMQFAEAEGFAHVHFHVVPRMADQPAEHRGPRIFAYLGHTDPARVTAAAQDDLALRLRAWLS